MASRLTRHHPESEPQDEHSLIDPFFFDTPFAAARPRFPHLNQTLDFTDLSTNLVVIFSTTTSEAVVHSFSTSQLVLSEHIV